MKNECQVQKKYQKVLPDKVNNSHVQDKLQSNNSQQMVTSYLINLLVKWLIACWTDSPLLLISARNWYVCPGVRPDIAWLCTLVGNLTICSIQSASAQLNRIVLHVVFGEIVQVSSTLVGDRSRAVKAVKGAGATTLRASV